MVLTQRSTGLDHPSADCVSPRPRPRAPRRETAWLVALALGVALLTALGAGARASYGARTTADEPQYLLTALSLAHDHDLDVSDERAARAYLPFHEVALPLQATIQPDGSQINPHDPLLPLLLALPVGAGGWLAAKLTIAALAGLLAATVAWTAVHRFGVGLRWAAAGAALFSLSPPLAVYATQIYPELLAALAVTVAAAAVLGPATKRHAAAFAVAVAALPWLSVKYAPVALTLGAVYALVNRRRAPRLVGARARRVGGRRRRLRGDEPAPLRRLDPLCRRLPLHGWRGHGHGPLAGLRRPLVASRRAARRPRLRPRRLATGLALRGARHRLAPGPRPAGRPRPIPHRNPPGAAPPDPITVGRAGARAAGAARSFHSLHSRGRHGGAWPSGIGSRHGAGPPPGRRLARRHLPGPHHARLVVPGTPGGGASSRSPSWPSWRGRRGRSGVVGSSGSVAWSASWPRRSSSWRGGPTG